MLLKPMKVRAYMRRLSIVDMTPAAALDGSGVGWEDVAGLQPMGDQVVANLFDQLALRTPAGFAFDCGRRARISDLGMVGYHMLYSPTMRDLFETWVRHSAIAHPPLASSFTVDGGCWAFRQWPRLWLSAPAMRFCVEAAITTGIKLLDELVDEPVRLTALTLPYPKPAHWREYEMLGFEELNFDGDGFIMQGSADDLGRVVSTLDTEVNRLCEQQCATQVALLTRAIPLGQKVEMLFRTGGEVPSLDEVARRLGMSRRLLQRGLAEEGLTYGKLLRSYRYQRAAQMLKTDGVSMKEIAAQLGFDDAGSFRRAFRQWAAGEASTRWRHGRSESIGL
jgi:AraC-like DNA-binding protein